MSETDARQVVAGVGLLLLGTAMVLGQGVDPFGDLPLTLAGLAGLALAAGALLLGTSTSGRPV